MKRSRAAVRRCVAFAAFVAAFFPYIGNVANAQRQSPLNVAIRTTDLGHQTYMLEGLGGNVTVAIGDNGIAMVDSQFNTLFDKLKAAIEALSNKPIKYLINTHSHTDHVGGNADFAKLGAIVIGHENARKRLAEGRVNGLTGVFTPPVAPEILPARTYKNWFTLRLDGREALVRHAPKAHTDGAHIFISWTRMYWQPAMLSRLAVTLFWILGAVVISME